MAGTFVRFLRMTLHLFCSQLNPSLSLSAPWSTAYLDVALICSAFKAFFTFTFLCRNSTAPTPPPWFTSYSDVPLHSTLFAVYRFFLSIEKLSLSASSIVPVFKVFLQVKVSEQNCNQSSIGIFLFFPFCSFCKNRILIQAILEEVAWELQPKHAKGESATKLLPKEPNCDQIMLWKLTIGNWQE